MHLVGITNAQQGPAFAKAVIYRRGELHELESLVTQPDLRLSRAVAINDKGQVLCQGFHTAARVIHSYLLTPDEADRDGDGLLDHWEEQGMDVNGDGIVDLDLPSLGADADRPDIFVEVDAMLGSEMLPEAELLVEAAFANRNVALHILRDEITVPISDCWSIDSGNCLGVSTWPSEFDRVKQGQASELVGFGTAQDRHHQNAAAILAAKKLAFRYCVFVRRIGTAPCNNDDNATYGKSELRGNDFIVAINSLFEGPGPTYNENEKALVQASAFMHELGHSLGLLHGGGDALNYKPNYYSIMNYTWLWPKDKWHENNPEWFRLDYSEANLTALTEGALDEQVGINAPIELYAGVSVVHGYTDLACDDDSPLAPMHGAVDWNGNGQYEVIPVPSDIEPGFASKWKCLLTNVKCCGDAGCAAGDLCVRPKSLTTLYGHNDWANLIYPVHEDFLGFLDIDRPGSIVVSEQSIAEIKQLIDGSNVSPPNVECSVDTELLMEYDHRLYAVGLAFSAVEGSSAIPDDSVGIEIWCDEPELPETGTGSGQFAPDARDIGTSLRVRGERNGSGNGRVYVIALRAVGATGDVGFAACTVSVPHGTDEASISQVQAAAQFLQSEYFNADGETIADRMEGLGLLRIGLSASVGPHQ